jgi:hypothetical protein
MRFMETYNDSSDYWINSSEKQMVDIWFDYDGVDLPDNIYYRAIKISSNEAAIEPAYISRQFKIDEMWGASK